MSFRNQKSNFTIRAKGSGGGLVLVVVGSEGLQHSHISGTAKNNTGKIAKEQRSEERRVGKERDNTCR